MYFETFENKYIHIELTKEDINYLLMNKSLSEFDDNYKIKLELIEEKE